jgi:hypothetical protein
MADSDLLHPTIEPICACCRHWQYRWVTIGKNTREERHCMQGVVHAGARLTCPAFEREPGSDDE